MCFMQSARVMFGVVCLVILSVPGIGVADNWWESGEDGAADYLVEETSSQNPNNLDHNEDEDVAQNKWRDGYIEVMAGAAADMKDAVNLAHAYSIALKTARHLAYEKLAETLTGLNVKSESKYDRELLIDTDLKTGLKALISNARVVDEKKTQFSDGSVWVEVTLGVKV